ncbi:MAG: N-acetylneuraminate synthase family protein [Dissulfurispiraceae bacterium]
MCLIIAEAGENHLGDMEIAKKLIDLSRNAGADYVKFQYYDAATCAADDPEKEWFEKVQLDIEKIKYLYDYCGRSGIPFMCTPWDAKKAEDLFSLGVRDMKIASFHITDTEMLRTVAKKAGRVFLSTGMSSVDEIDAAAALLKGTELYLLHCVSEYPLAEERVNLLCMDFLRERYGCRVGYSDHTLGILAPLAAVARGADVIEKHITLSKTFFGTDHILSADPAELKLLVEYAGRIGKMLGSKEKTITDTELASQAFLRNRFNHENK